MSIKYIVLACKSLDNDQELGWRINMKWLRTYLDDSLSCNGHDNEVHCPPRLDLKVVDVT